MPQRGKERLTDSAVAALLSCPTIREAAERCGVSRRTMLRWQRSKRFQRVYEAAKSRLLESVINGLRSGGWEAATTLREIAADKTAPAAARVSAARCTLEMLFRGVELVELEARVLSIEESLAREAQQK